MKNMSLKSFRLLTPAFIFLLMIFFHETLGTGENSYLRTDYGILARGTVPGKIGPGKTNTHEVLINKAELANLCCFWKNGDLKIKLKDPLGNIYERSKFTAEFSVNFIEFKPGSVSWAPSRYMLSGNYPTGLWTMEISMPDSAREGTEYSISLFYEKPELDINTTKNKRYPKTEEPITITTTLKRGDSPVLDATVRAVIRFERQVIDTITLFDNGEHDDSLADDGLYVFEYLIPPQGGYYSVSIFAKKTGDDTFDRIDETAFIAHVNKSSIGEPVSERVIDTTGDGLYDQLIISYSFDITQKDNYELGASLYDYNNEMICNTGVDTILSPGSQIVEFVFDGDEIYDHGVDGPYIIEGVSIADTSDLLDHKENVYSTKEYNYRDFQHCAIVITGEYTIEELDMDKNGLIDSLIFNFEVDILFEGEHRWTGWLRKKGEFREFSLARGNGYLESGIQNLQLSFSGSTIRKSRINGPCIINADFMWNREMTEKAKTCTWRHLQFKTKEYKYTNFE